MLKSPIGQSPKESNSHLSSLTLEVLLCILWSSMADFEPCNRVVQRVYAPYSLLYAVVVSSENLYVINTISLFNDFLYSHHLCASQYSDIVKRN